MVKTIIQTRNLSKSYAMGRSTVNALAGIDLGIKRGSFVAIIGPSGSGKSTLLHLIGGLDRPSAGSIKVDGLSLEELDENALAGFRRTKVGIIFQAFNLIPGLSAVENVAFPLRFNGSVRQLRKTRALKVLDDVGLSDRAQHRPGELSGGQQQRVAMARALINDPEIILADEPTGNLDTRSGGQVMELLAALHHQGRTVLVVSHDPRVTHFATQIIYLLDGRVENEDEFNRTLAMASKESDEE